jgi:hypothetical protein
MKFMAAVLRASQRVEKWMRAIDVLSFEGWA